MFFSPFNIAITSLGKERANLSVFRTFVRFVLVWICRFPLPLGVWEGLRFVIVALPGLLFYLFFEKPKDRPGEVLKKLNIDMSSFMFSLHMMLHFIQTCHIRWLNDERIDRLKRLSRENTSYLS